MFRESPRRPERYIPQLPAWPPFVGKDGNVLDLSDPITIGDVSSIHGLKVFDAVYSSVRAQPLNEHQSNRP